MRKPAKKHPMTPGRLRLIAAIKRLGKTEAEAADRAGFTVRTIDKWETGEGCDTTVKLIDNGILHVAGDCPCSRHSDETVTA